MNVNRSTRLSVQSFTPCSTVTTNQVSESHTGNGTHQNKKKKLFYKNKSSGGASSPSDCFQQNYNQETLTELLFTYKDLPGNKNTNIYKQNRCRPAQVQTLKPEPVRWTGTSAETKLHFPACTW